MTDQEAIEEELARERVERLESFVDDLRRRGLLPGLPLEVTARLNGPVCMPYGPPALDGILAWAVCQRDGIEPALRVRDMVPVEVPIQREPGGRFHLASCAQFEVEAREGQWTNRRFPMEWAQMLAPVSVTETKKGLKTRPVTSILISGGPSKSFRIPREVLHLEGDTMRWWCLGDRQEIENLLSFVLFVCKRRGVGLGEVAEWTVRECKPWDGFPVVRDGAPLRPLPPDWPGLVEPEMGFACITYPYWLAEEEQVCAVPSR